MVKHPTTQQPARKLALIVALILLFNSGLFNVFAKPGGEPDPSNPGSPKDPPITSPPAIEFPPQTSGPAGEPGPPDNRKKTELRNEYIEAAIDKDGLFTMGTTGGDPTRDSDNFKLLLYGHPYPWTSYTTIKIGNNSRQFKAEKQPILNDVSKHNTSRQTMDGIEITQTLSFYLNPNTKREDIIQVKYEMKNTTSTAKEVGARIMLDPMLGDNDGAPFIIDGVGQCTTEMQFEGDDIPQSWWAYDSFLDPGVISAGTFYYDMKERPDKVQFTAWPDVYKINWSYEAVPGKTILNDSAVTVFFNPATLTPGATRTVVTYYGLNDFAAKDLRPPLAIGVFAPQELALNGAGNGYAPNPISISAQIQNIGDGDAPNTEAWITLPEGMTIVEGNRTVSLGTMEPGQAEQITWKVQVANQTTARVFDYQVFVTASNTETKMLRLQLSVPGISASGGGGFNTGSASSNRSSGAAAQGNWLISVDDSGAATININGNVNRQGQLTFLINNAMISAAVRAAQNEAGALSTDSNINVVVNVPDASIITRIIPRVYRSAQNRLSAMGVGLTITTPLFECALDSTAINELYEQTKSNLTISAVPITALPQSVIGADGVGSVFGITFISGKTIIELKEGVVTYGVPYTADEDAPADPQIFKIDGLLEWIEGSFFENGWLYWSGEFNGLFGAGYASLP
jgi:hypothetical protein